MRSLANRNDVITVENSTSSPITLQTRIFDMLSEAFLRKATYFIRSHLAETDAIVFREGLNAIKCMCDETKNLNLSLWSRKNELIKEELLLSAKEVYTIVMKVRRQRLPFSDAELRSFLEVKNEIEDVLGVIKGISSKQTTIHLLEPPRT